MKTHPSLQRPRAIALAVALVIGIGPGLLLPVSPAWAAKKTHGQAAKQNQQATVTLNFVNAEIDGVARAMAAILNKQILVDPRVKGTITLYSDQPMTPAGAYKNFLAALRGQGFSMVEVAGLLKIVPEAEAKLQTGVVDVGHVGRSGDQVLTQIFRVQYENANNLVTVLRPLISPNNTINANVSTNTLVITDYADNLKRMAQMIAALDVPQSTDMEAIPLQYGVAADVAPVVQKLLDGGGAAGAAAGGGVGQSATVIADSRTNSLMIKAPNAARLNMIRGLVARLDRPGTAGVGGSGIHVVYLKNADAVKLATVLRASFPQGGSGSGGSSGGGSPTASTPNAGAAMAGASGASQQSTTPVGASAQPSTGGFIQADPSTNSLVITASEALYKQLRAVIDQLDTRRAQIYVEAMIVEVSESKMAQAGVQWAAAAGSNNIVGVGSGTASGTIPSIFSLSSSIGTAAASLTGFNVALVHKNSAGVFSLGALASFLETNADGNVLSKPNMIALDNEEAKIVVGQNVPFVTGSYASGSTSSSGSVNPFTTVERKDVGLTLRVRPQVGEGNTVRMTVFQENSSVDSASKSSSTGLTTNKSSIETTVVIDDGQILVLGGLLKDGYSDGDSKVPLLGDIPIIGNLFKARSRSREKTNLMVFLRPVVMRTQDEANALTLDRYDFIRQQQLGTKPEPSRLLGNIDTNAVDELKLTRELAPVPQRPTPDNPTAGSTTRLVPVKPAPAPADEQR
jgi:general secretion pathway protein D